MDEGSSDGDAGADDTVGTSEASDHPIDGTALLKAAAIGSVPADRLPDLLGRVQAHLAPRIDEYRREYERVESDPDLEAFLVERGHWDGIAARLELSDRERDAAARAHATAVERLGTDTGRRAEFETALEIRSAVVIGIGTDAGTEPRANATEGNGRE